MTGEEVMRTNRRDILCAVESFIEGIANDCDYDALEEFVDSMIVTVKNELDVHVENGNSAESFDGAIAESMAKGFIRRGYVDSENGAYAIVESMIDADFPTAGHATLGSAVEAMHSRVFTGIARIIGDSIRA